jgi:propionyl-CoA carboxylase alpha chain
VDSTFGSIRLTLVDQLPAPSAKAEPGSLLAPMPGSVVRIEAAVGDRVIAGQVIAVLEAMKMEHQVAAPAAGVLAEVRAAAGVQVNAGDVLAVVTPDGHPGVA